MKSLVEVRSYSFSGSFYPTAGIFLLNGSGARDIIYDIKAHPSYWNKITAYGTYVPVMHELGFVAMFYCLLGRFTAGAP
jgi:hypothetical protein